MPSTESTKSATTPPLSECWREVQGINDWKNLLDATGGESVDENLRREIIRYGEFAQACYDGFQYDEASPQCGNAKFKRHELLASVGLPDTGYEITKYIYATSKLWLPGFFKQPQTGEDTWSRNSNWMGFIAVATSEEEVKRLGRRDIVIAWRGTVSRLEWIKNITDILKPSELDPHDDLAKGIDVEAGFLDVYTAYIPNSRYNHQSARYQVLFEVTRLLNLYRKDEMSITVTGHSLGGALSLLCGYDLAELGANYSQLSPLTPSPEIRPLSPYLLSPRLNLQNTMAMASATSVHNDSTRLKEKPDHETKVEVKHEEADLNSPASSKVEVKHEQADLNIASPASSKVDVDAKLEEDKVAITKGKLKSTLVKDTLTVEIKEKGNAPPRILITVFSFSQPRVGSAELKARCDELEVKVLRVLNGKDIVPKVPGVLLNEHMWVPVLKKLDFLPWAYVHVGTSFELDSKISPYLREDGGLVEQHNLEALLHLVDGYQGPNKPFVSSGRRELKLVNKSSDFLKPDLGVPPHWRK